MIAETFTNNEAIGRLFRFTGGWNELRMPAIFPDKVAPTIRRRPVTIIGDGIVGDGGDVVGSPS